MIIERYRLKNLNGMKGSLLENLNGVTFNKGYGEFNGVSCLRNTTVANPILNTSRTYICEYKTLSHSRWCGMVSLDNNANNLINGIHQFITSGGIRLAEGNGDGIISQEVSQIGKWYHIILTYDTITGKCECWKEGKYLGSYNGNPNYIIPPSSLGIGMIDNFANTTFRFTGGIKEVELYNNSVSNAFAKNKYMQSKGIF